MHHQPIHSSRYGMAVSTGSGERHRRRGVRTLRWSEISDAMRRVVDGVRMTDDFEPIHPDVSSAAQAGSHAGGEYGQPAKRLTPQAR